MSGSSIDFFFRPYHYNHDFCQSYYWEGLRRHLAGGGDRFRRIPMSRFPRTLHTLGRIKNSYSFQKIIRKAGLSNRIIDNMAGFIEGGIRAPFSHFVPTVGQYVAHLDDGRECKVCIDSADSGTISSREMLEWSDIYFKTNFWKTGNYPAKVYPMYNANPFVLGRLPELRSYRSSEKKYDLCFIVRVWGGTDEVEGVEHNIRMLEAVARADCRKFLFAYLVAGDIAKYARRLDASGIPWSTTPMKMSELWNISAQSRMNVIRLGMHYCVPWRMIDMLAMGACTVLDSAPYTVWPQPLRENENFLSLGLECNLQNPLAPQEKYSMIPRRIESWLEDDFTIRRISNSNGDYFDRFVEPEKIGGYIVKTVTGFNGKK